MEHKPRAGASSRPEQQPLRIAAPPPSLSIVVPLLNEAATLNETSPAWRVVYASHGLTVLQKRK